MRHDSYQLCRSSHNLFRMDSVSLSLGLENTHVVITGAAGEIGRTTVSAFLSAGAKVSCFDIDARSIARLEHRSWDIMKGCPDSADMQPHVVDVTIEQDMVKAFGDAIENYGPVQCCVALAALDLSVLPHHQSLCEMPLDQWKRTFNVNVHGVFITAKTWLKSVKHYAGTPLSNVSLIIVGSESSAFGDRCNADYASGKSAVQVGLLQSLRADIPRIFPGAR